MRAFRGLAGGQRGVGGLLVALALAVGACVARPPVEETIPATPAFATATSSIAVVSPTAAVPQESRAATAPPAAPPPAASVALPSPIDRNLYELTQRLRLRSATPIATALPGPAPARQVGDQETFWLTNFETFGHFTATATLRLVTDHTYVYVEDGLSVDAEALRRAALQFDRTIYPSVHRDVGEERNPGIDNDPHLVVVNARIPGVGGYYSVADEYPKLVNPFSNEREVIYVNVDNLRLGTSGYDAVLAHEFTHAAHWNLHPNEEGWISEGTAELGAMLIAQPRGYNPAFRQQPDTQLTTWAELPAESGPHYGAAQLFMTYLAEHYGGYGRLKDILAQQVDGIDGINAYLKQAGYAADFDAVFRDWVVANYLDGSGVDRYNYRDLDVRLDVPAEVGIGSQISGTVHQYAARYYRLKPGPAGRARLSFEGDREVRTVPNAAHGGVYQWWGNRGDAIDTTLTRDLDLTGLSRATLRYWVWYHIEENWDYAYLEVSADGGRTWELLTAPGMKTTNPLGNAFGPGYTGVSGRGKEPIWVEEAVDLSPYAGKRILVRFEYVTDEAFNDVGLALDDLSVPELGYSDGAESGDGGWIARGFARIDNRLPQRWSVQLIRPGNPPRVEAVPLDAGQRGETVVEGDSVLVIAGLTPVTTEPARFRLGLETTR